jgi:type III secretory pathway component EscU
MPNFVAMKTSLKIVFPVIVFGLIIMSVVPALAQCAACAAAVKTNSASGSVTANGLNHGIIFLLMAPYLAVGIVAYVWYKKFRRKNVTLDIHNEKLHLN